MVLDLIYFRNKACKLSKVNAHKQEKLCTQLGIQTTYIPLVNYSPFHKHKYCKSVCLRKETLQGPCTF